MPPLQTISKADLLSLPRDELKALAKQVMELDKRQSQNELANYSPYRKQIDFHTAGKNHDERLLMAGNQLGKTFAAAYETAMHMTGRYPSWWKGRTYDRPVKGWVGGVTQESTRDNPQRVLLGEPSAAEKAYGTGTIPGASLIKVTRARGIPNSVNSIVAKHDSGKGHSIIVFKNYEQGVTKWMGETLDFVWFDEEPPADIYSEGNTRTAATRGFTMITFTPLLGMSEVVRQFLSDDNVSKMRDAA